MRYLSICSGIEAATVAWHPLGWQAMAFAEIDAFPSAVVAHHYPTVPNWGDITKFKDWPDATLDLLVGGTPCQSFSVAGLRKGLADPRGNLALTYLAIADRYRPEWLVWENVPGVLSSGGGRDFGAFLGGLVELGYGWAYRVLDAQYFGVAQRRRRVFVVASTGGWQRAAAVLFDGTSLRGDSPPRRETGQRAPTIPSRSTAGGGLGTDFDCDGGLIADVAPTLNAAFGKKLGLENQHIDSGAGMFIAFSVKDHGADAGELAPTLRSGGHNKSHANGGVMPAIAFAGQAGGDRTASGACHEELSPTLHKSQIMDLMHRMQVRRLTPRECERLQGFPDDYTLIPYRGKPAADGPRYKALGNSMAVPVMAWIGRRLAEVQQCEAA